MQQQLCNKYIFFPEVLVHSGHWLLPGGMSTAEPGEERKKLDQERKELDQGREELDQGRKELEEERKKLAEERLLLPGFTPGALGS